MSTFIWGKIKLKELLPNFRSYQKGNILVYFHLQKNHLYISELGEHEIYFNIACGYEKIISLNQYNYLNCDDLYFSLNFPKRLKRVKDCTQYEKDLYARIKDLQSVITDLYNRDEISCIEYYHTEQGGEHSVNEYQLVDWKIYEFADKFYGYMKNNCFFTPTIRVFFDK